MSKQFALTRNTLLGFVKNLDENVADIQPDHFNNTLRWHIGHILVSAEGFLFGYPKKTTSIPEAYNNLFSTGTKPADWTTEAPNLSDLINHLEDQQKQINDLSKDYFEQPIPFTLPFGDFRTYGDIFDFVLVHEADHVGQMKAMKKIVVEN